MDASFMAAYLRKNYMSIDERIDEQTMVFIYIGIPLALRKKMLIFILKNANLKDIVLN